MFILIETDSLHPFAVRLPLKVTLNGHGMWETIMNSNKFMSKEFLLLLKFQSFHVNKPVGFCSYFFSKELVVLLL